MLPGRVRRPGHQEPYALHRQGLWPCRLGSRIPDPGVSYRGAISKQRERVSPMYDRILMAVDHSDVTGRVINAAREMASLSDGEVWVLHVQEKEVMPRGGFFA